MTAKSPLVALLASLRSMRSHTARCFARGGGLSRPRHRTMLVVHRTHPGVGSSITLLEATSDDAAPGSCRPGNRSALENWVAQMEPRREYAKALQPRCLKSLISMDLIRYVVRSSSGVRNRILSAPIVDRLNAVSIRAALSVALAVCLIPIGDSTSRTVRAPVQVLGGVRQRAVQPAR